MGPTSTTFRRLLPPVFILLLAFPLLRAQAPAPAPRHRGPAAGDGPGAFTPAQLETMRKLRDAALADPWGMTSLRHLTDNIGPRLAGSPEADEAVRWVAAQMRSLGAEVTLEPAKVPHWVRGAETAELVSWPGQTPGRTKKVVLAALGMSVATPPEGLTADLLVVHNFAELAALPAGAAKGKIVLFDHPFDKQLAASGNSGAAYGGAVAYRAMGPVAAAKAGAIACLVRSAGGADYRLPHTGMTDYDPAVTKIPAAALAAEDAEILDNLSGQGPLRMHLTLTPQTLPDAATFNVIADWKGTEHPEQVVVVSGHIDSWDLGTGAYDDGAGVAASMQVIHVLSQLGIRPRRTIRFVAWMDEEEGSQGADFYMKDFKDQVKNHVGAIESDGGPGHPTGLGYAGKPELREWIAPVATILDSFGAGRLVASGGIGADIDGLTQAGVPSFGPEPDGRDYFDYHHTAADTWDKVSPRTFNENSALMAVVAYALADSAEPAPR